MISMKIEMIRNTADHKLDDVMNVIYMLLNEEQDWLSKAQSIYGQLNAVRDTTVEARKRLYEDVQCDSWAELCQKMTEIEKLIKEHEHMLGALAHMKEVI